MKNSPDIRNKGFHLTKWFLDFIGEDGTVMIAYAARLTWRGISVPYANMLWYRPGEPVKEKNRYTQAHLPKIDRESILSEQASRFTLEQIERTLKSVRATARYLTQNVNARLAMEVLSRTTGIASPTSPRS